MTARTGTAQCIGRYVGHVLCSNIAGSAHLTCALVPALFALTANTLPDLSISRPGSQHRSHTAMVWECSTADRYLQGTDTHQWARNSSTCSQPLATRSSLESHRRNVQQGQASEQRRR